MKTWSLLFLLLYLPVFGQSFKGKMSTVVSGDLIWVHTANGQAIQVKLLGIQAPPLRSPWRQFSACHLRDLLNGVDLEVRPSPQKYPSMGICLGKVLIYDGQLDVNAEQLKLGLASWDRSQDVYLFDEDRWDYENAQRQAQEVHIGIWER